MYHLLSACVYACTPWSVSGDTVQYTLEESVSARVLEGDTTVYLFTDAQVVYFLYSTIPSVTCLRLSDASVICRVTYFQFPIQSPFLARRQSGSCSGVRGLPYIGHPTLPKMWEVRFLYAAYSPAEWFWIDFKCKKMETKHPVEGYFGSAKCMQNVKIWIQLSLYNIELLGSVIMENVVRTSLLLKCSIVQTF